MTTPTSAADIAELVGRVGPGDQLEAAHRQQALDWLAGTEDVFRRVKPDRPSPHLVSYLVPLDVVRRRLLLVGHRRSGLWLPPGGHVEPGEHPRQTARRECVEELGTELPLLEPDHVFLTVTPTVEAIPHLDVSLWFLLGAGSEQELAWDRREFSTVRWWTPAEVRRAPAADFDPQLGRFLAKLDATGVWPDPPVGGEGHR